MAIVFPIDVILMKKNRNSIGLAERAQVSFTHSTATTSSSSFFCFLPLSEKKEERLEVIRRCGRRGGAGGGLAVLVRDAIKLHVGARESRTTDSD